MITKEQILNLIQPQLEEDECYLVSLKVGANNAISVEVDSFNSVTIDYCVKISRLIEGSLDREAEDFELEVASPGLSQPFKVFQQYLKNIGNEVEIFPKNEKPLKGILISADEKSISIQYSEKKAVEGKKKKETVEVKREISFDEILKTQLVISFK